MAGPLIFYRLWCGRKCYSAWLPDRDDVFALAVSLGLAFSNGDTIGLGPLTRIEVGQRKYTRSKTVPVQPVRRA